MKKLIIFSSSLFTFFLHLLHYFTRFTFSSKRVSVDLKNIEIIETMEQKHDFIHEKKEFLKFSSPKNVEKPASEVPFTFKFPTFEEFSKDHKDFSNTIQFPLDSQGISLQDSDFHLNSNDGFQSNEYNAVNFPKGLEENEEIHTFEKLHKLHGEIVYSSTDSNTDSVISNENKTTHVDENKEIHNKTVYISSDLNVFNNPNSNSPTSDLKAEDRFLCDTDFETTFDEKNISENGSVTESRNISEPKTRNENERANKLECLWEHQELIEQLKMEIKKVKEIGLPTIFEESESSPKIVEELKPWRIENTCGNMSQVHKFYKSYRERMRKFDIFNYQKMYAIGFLQLKDPLWSSSTSKSPVPEFSSLFNQSFTTKKGKKYEDNPTTLFIKQLHSDLEVVYVGQMCMSWEILHWQYEKALDIWDSDPRGTRRFNKIADEFQQFQVLMQRFIENEPFQGPRVEHYVKSRCVFRNLLQVPVIRADEYMKSGKVRGEEVVYDITSDVLVEILEESIRVFWRFVRADKCKRHTPVELQKPEDLQLFLDLQKDLHKKERKLKEQLKSGNRVLKMFRSCREDEETDDQVLYFFCQVDMKLVSRVLQMTKLTTDQLVWCRNKLSKVSFVNRKIHVEPSFLLFPC